LSASFVLYSLPQLWIHEVVNEILNILTIHAEVAACTSSLIVNKKMVSNGIKFANYL